MPINFTDFSRAPLVDNGLGDLIGKAIQGFQAQRMPGMMNRQQQQEELRNKLLGMKNEYYPKIQDQALEKGALGIQADQLNLGALPGKLADESQHRGLVNKTAQLNLDQAPELMQLKRDQVRAAIAKANRPTDPTLSMRREQKIRSNAWDAMPPNVKQNTVSVLNGLGMRPDEAVTRLANGETVDDIAKDMGYTSDQVNKVMKKSLPTTTNITRENQRMANVAELNVLEDRVSDAMAPYVQTFAGMSPKAIVDQFKGGNDDELAKYLAARSLQSEMAALRLKVMSANVGQNALHEMVVGAFGNSKVLPSGLSPEVYKKMNNYVSQWLNEASGAAHSEMMGQPAASNKDPLGIR